MQLSTGILTVKPQYAILNLPEYTDHCQPFLLFTMANQRMATTTNKGLGHTPSWTDNLQFFIYGDELSIKVLVSDRLASHDSSSEAQIFVTANIDLTRFLDRGHARGTFSNWYDLMSDGKIIGALHLMFDFHQRALTETESACQRLGG